MTTDYIKQQWKPILIQCCAWANLSPDPSTQNAAVLVGVGSSDNEVGRVFTETFSVNEFPRGVAYLDERWERPPTSPLSPMRVWRGGRVAKPTVNDVASPTPRGNKMSEALKCHGY